MQKTGYYLPESVAGNALVALGAGLMTTFSPSTSDGQWIGFQILAGFGRGMIVQLLITAAQANCKPEDTAIATSYVMFANTMGGAIFVALGRTVLTATLGRALGDFHVPLDPALIINTGVTELRHIVPQEYLEGVILAYNQALDNVFVSVVSFRLLAVRID